MDDTTAPISLPAPAGAWGRELRATIALAWPLVLTNLSQIALATTDVIMMGWLGPDYLAAGALGVNLNFAFLIFGIGLVTITSSMIAIELGRKRHSVRDVRRSVRQGIWVAVSFAVPVWLVLWQAEHILRALGQDPHLSSMAAGYLHTFQWSMLPVPGLHRPAQFRRRARAPDDRAGDRRRGRGAERLPRLGAHVRKARRPGAGPAGGRHRHHAHQYLHGRWSCGLIYRDRRFRRYHLLGRFWRADWPRFVEIWRLGLPIAFTLAFEVTVFNAAVFLMGLIGKEALAAHSVAIQIASVAFMVPLGLGMSATVRVGLAYGANDHAGIARAGWAAFGLAFGYSCCTAIAMIFFGRALVGVFLPLGVAENQPVIALATAFLVFAGIFQLADGAQATASGMLRGLNDTRVPMVYAAVGYWVMGLPLAAFLGLATPLKGRGIWMGLAGGLAVVAVLMTWRWVRREALGLTRRHAGEAPPAAMALH